MSERARTRAFGAGLAGRAALVLACALAMAGCGPRKLRALEADSLVRVMTCSVDSQRGVEALREVVEEWKPDVVLVQSIEKGTHRALGADLPAELSRATGLPVVWAPLSDEPGGVSGLATLSRVGVERQWIEKFDRISPNQTQQGALGVEIDWGGTPLILWNVRMGSANAGELYAQARQLVRLKESRAGTAQIFAGDFGMEPGAAPLETLRSAGLNDAWKVRGSGLGYTEPAFRPRRRLDYFWMPEGSPYRAENILVVNAPAAGKHLPVVLDLAPESIPPTPLLEGVPADEGAPPADGKAPSDGAEVGEVERVQAFPRRSGPDLPGITRPFSPGGP